MNCEIEFLPVGEKSKPGDAIVVRYGDVNSFELMVVDGGNLESGKSLVEHIRQEFGNHRVANVVLTHADADHASGLRELLKEIPVDNLWLHIPWLLANEAKSLFQNKNWADAGLTEAIQKEYDVIKEIFDLGRSNCKNIYYPFAGSNVGPFRVLSPHRQVYLHLLPQFDKTPAADQAAIEAAGFWIGKAQSLPLSAFFEKLTAKVQKLVKETWAVERLKDGGVTSASNESSVVLYGDFGPGRKVLLTGDGGPWALSLAAYAAEQAGLPLKDFMFVQIPHHGSRRNVGPTVLNRLLGPIQQENTSARFSAFVSAPKADDIHPRKMVLNAFIRRGATVIATQGTKKVFWGGFPPRAGYIISQSIPFTADVEDYDS
jgi:beta-lactamase superfamily II metal-dependent hydrolase